MKVLKWIAILLLGFTGLEACHFQSSGQPEKGKLFIIGGGQRPISMVREIIAVANLDDAKNFGVVLPMASSVPDTSAYYAIRQFKEVGGKNLHTFNFGDSTITTIEAKLDSLKKASLLYIPGGVQSRFMEAVDGIEGMEEALEEAYENGAVIAGTSAGAAVMSEIMITGDQIKYPEYTPTFYHLEHNNIDTSRGMGLIKDAIIDQHFIKRARNNRLLTAVMEFPERVGIGIDESTAIIVEGNEARVVGESQVLVYRNVDESVVIEDGKLGSLNIRLDIYLPGDQFYINGQ
ncbi:cyanophycinase [Fodinibius sp. SL11]|uniref:cyanophycinase n=1 Tax=Fodinibius sp. SL11 TaxID=3425690 RepID=UPI003F882467